ncbi:Uma2 family endonuclease [Iningainema tapete]|uniref:Uma2 family endonuclease n=1 Tax=Iningainema tapete BLCC-T55 TaxID=2748662 RepID=A0A8J6XLY3_9CYAN|nr:Uma2 family endonuclease [Iningainema tapete]MBD2774109.1 Uma2 family endonuclease [Iningainema tapete BLCC-T55]
MTSLLEEITQIQLQADDPEEQHIVTGVSWEQYEAFLSRLGDSSGYRITYLEGVLEIVSPSRRHEVSKKNIGRLLEVYFEENRIRFWALGSTTLRKQEKKGGKEPDECYCIGTEKEFPDLAIEVVFTSGGIDKLEVYKRLGVREVWFWHNNQFSIYSLQGDKYEQISKSELLPDLDLALLAEYVMQPDPLEAMLDFRAKIRGGDAK